MKTKIAIYLAGTIKKGHEKSDETYWTDEDMSTIKKCLSKFEVSFLNPAFRTDDLSDQFSVFGRDMLQVFSSHFVFVDARDRRGLGVGAEMMWAKVNNIPVITWAPRNSHYHKDQATVLGKSVTNFVHPFVESLSDKIAINLVEGAQWIEHVINNPSVKIKGIEYINSAMNHYKNNQFHLDVPMQDLVKCEVLNSRLNRKQPALRS